MKKIEERKRKLSSAAERTVDDVSKQKKTSEETEPIIEATQVKTRKRKKNKKQTAVEEAPVEDEKTPVTFLVLGKDDHARRDKTKRVLPQWLKNASVVSIDLKNLTDSVDSISNLDHSLVDALKANGISHFFPGNEDLLNGFILVLLAN